MANRRMFACSIINSWRFCKLPDSARLLYYDLGMEADDEGFVEAYYVIHKTRGSLEDLQILHNSGLIQILDDEDFISHITDWKINNHIRSERKTPSIYLEKYGNQLTTKAQPIDNQKTAENSIGENSIDYYSSSLGEEKGREGSAGREGKQPTTQITPQNPYTATPRNNSYKEVTEEQAAILKAPKIGALDEIIERQRNG